MSQLELFDTDPTPAHGMYRPTDLEPAHDAAVAALPIVQANRLLILRLLCEHDVITMFDPYVLKGCDPRFKQTAIGPRFKKLRLEGMIEEVEARRALAGAETQRVVSAYRITDAGRAYLAQHRDEVPS